MQEHETELPTDRSGKYKRLGSAVTAPARPFCPGPAAGASRVQSGQRTDSGPRPPGSGLALLGDSGKRSECAPASSSGKR